MFSVGFWQLFEQMANCSASQVSDLFGSSAVLGPSGSHPWLLGGSEDPWLSVPVFWRVWLFELYVNLSIVVQSQIAMLPNDVRFGLRAQPVDATPALNRSAGFRTPESCKAAL